MPVLESMPSMDEVLLGDYRILGRESRCHRATVTINEMLFPHGCAGGQGLAFLLEWMVKGEDIGKCSMYLQFPGRAG